MLPKHLSIARSWGLLRDACALLPGVGVSTLFAAAVTAAVSVVGGAPLLLALLIGIVFSRLGTFSLTKPGIEFTARTLLRFGVALLGGRITIGQLTALGWSTMLIVVIGVATTMLFAMVLGRRLGLSPAESVLGGGAVAICGASAALALSAVLPPSPGRNRYTLLVVVIVTVMSTMAMFAYPAIAVSLSLTPVDAGLFIGGTIHDVAQVVGAGYSLGETTGDFATVVKLFRVALLSVVVVGVSASFKRTATSNPMGCKDRVLRLFSVAPWFLWMFVALAFINSLGMMTTNVQSALGDFSKALLTMAMVALGLSASFGELARAGWRPLVLIGASTAWLAVLVLACLHLFGR